MNEHLVLMDLSQAVVVLAGGCAPRRATMSVDLPVKRLDRCRLPVGAVRDDAKRALAALRPAGA